MADALPMDDWHKEQVEASMKEHCRECGADPGEPCIRYCGDQEDHPGIPVVGPGGFGFTLPGGWTHSVRWPHNKDVYVQNPR